MSLMPVMLILISCFTHAGWHLMARHRLHAPLRHRDTRPYSQLQSHRFP